MNFSELNNRLQYINNFSLAAIGAQVVLGAGAGFLTAEAAKLIDKTICSPEARRRYREKNIARLENKIVTRNQQAHSNSKPGIIQKFQNARTNSMKNQLASMKFRNDEINEQRDKFQRYKQQVEESY